MLEEGMNMEILQPMIALLGGGFAGYSTNYYAIKMLFKKYGPFGGMIIETRQQFTASMSQVVERDIINNHTIEHELTKFEFQRVLYNMVSQVLKTHLYKHTAARTIIEIPGMPETIDKLLEFYKNSSPQLAGDSIYFLLDAIQVTDILSEKQRVFLMEKLWELFLREGQESHGIEKVIQGLYQENKDKFLGDFIPSQVFTSIGQQAASAISHFYHNAPKEFAQDIHEISEKLYDELECSAILQSFEKKIKSKSVIELLGREHAEIRKNEMIEGLIALLQSGEGEILLKEFTKESFEFFKSIELSIFSLLHEEMGKNLENYLQQKLPAVVETIIYWIKDNQSELDSLINDSIDAVLAKGSRGFFDFRGKGKQALKSAIYENAAGEFAIMDYIIESIEQGMDVNKISSKVTKLLINYLKEHSIGQMFSLLENKKMLTSEDLASLIKKNANVQVISRSNSIFEELFSCPIGDVFTMDISQAFKDVIKNTLITQCKTKLLFTTTRAEKIGRKAAHFCTSLAGGKISQMLSLEGSNKMATFGEKTVFAVFDKKKQPLMQLLLEKIAASIGENKLSYYWKGNVKKNGAKAVADHSFAYLKKKIAAGQLQLLTNVYDAINRKKDSVKEVTSLLIELSNKNLQVILEGKIRDSVAANLAKLPDAEIQAIVENIMGKELQPINLFGAILGSITGLFLYFAQSALPVPMDSGTELLLSVAAYGFIGYITNVIALQMIFKPYYKKVVMGINIPFTPGVVAKQKPRFAASMGEFVEESLLDGSKLQHLFKENRSSIEENFQKNLSVENYKAAETLLLGNKEFISDKLLGFLLRPGDKKKDILFSPMIEVLTVIHSSELFYGELEGLLLDKGHTCLENKEKLLSKELQELLQSNERLESLVPEALQRAINDFIDRILGTEVTKLIAKVQDDATLLEMIAEGEKAFAAFIPTTIEEQLTWEQRNAIKDTITTYFIQKIQSPAMFQKLVSWLDEKIAGQVTPDKQLGELFGGNLIAVFQENVEFIMARVVGNAQTTVEKQRDVIKKEIYATFRKKATLITRLADHVLDIESSIYQVVDHFIDEKLPNYTKAKEDEFRKILIEIIQGKVAKSKVSELGITMDGKGVKKVIARLLASKHPRSGVTKLTDLLLDSFYKVPLKKILHSLSMESISHIYKVFAREVGEARLSLTAQLVDKEAIILQELGIFIKKVFKRKVLPLRVHELTSAISQIEVEKFAKNILTVMADSKVVTAQLEDYSRNISGKIKATPLNELLDFSLVKEDSDLLFMKIIQEEERRRALELALQEIINPIVENCNAILAPDTKDFIAHIIIASILDSLEEHLLEVMKAVNVKEVTTREINNMEPKEIEGLFHSFARPYFKKIERYGWFGGGFAVVTSMIEKIWVIIGK